MTRHTIKVAIAEDNKVFASIMHEHLSQQPDIELVGVAYDGEQILNIITEKGPDVVLLDIIMPHLDGIEALERIKHIKSKRPKIIVLTSMGQETLAQRIIELGVDYYLLKPINLDVMTKRIKQLLEAPERVATPEAIESWPVNTMVTNAIRKIGIPAHIKGYQYLRDAIIMIVGNIGLLGTVTKEVYPTVARKYSTTPSRVETAIRHSIEVAWKSRNKDMINGLYGYTININKGKPTNSEFMALVADKLRMARRA